MSSDGQRTLDNLGIVARPRAGSSPTLRVGFLPTHNFTLSALSLFVDTLRLAADEGDRSRPIRCQWSIMSATPQPIRASCGLTINRTAPLSSPTDFDYVVVVGGILHGGDQTDVETIRWLKTAAAAGVTLIGVCTGSFVLSRAGLMNRRRVCVSWYHVPDFADEFPDQIPVADRLYVDEGDRITCSGGAGVADLAAHLVERHIGRTPALKALHVMQVQTARGADAAQPHLPIGEGLSDERVRRALLLMEQHIADPIAVEDIAGRIELSPRQLERLFRSTLGDGPAVVYRRMRLGHARWLIENTQKNLTTVAVETGFCDASHFSRQFRAAYGFSPSELRSDRTVVSQPTPEPTAVPPRS